ncbi:MULTISPECIES: dihydropteroate synthase [Halolamina]|uniref:Probable bifunctional folylpolyglutamate synthase/dihydropteroate synthase n=1 Tax=Halolamina pelagica TaxID=699431 RepID=A0A1I5NK31_9EURY|nr:MULTISPECIES: dihydropteroate synthase [Halolamina]NHX36359.1 dihydropteroate synthase [Halolamina sp. R1-12]SFP22185.1 dihydropteroate synthase [Halolamina pelagica]
MHYHEAANFLFDLRRFGVDPGVEAVQDLLAAVDVDPGSGDGPAYVQVAGTNGKGSTARMVESALREAGRSVGLYTSPHLEHLTERVRVDGRELPRSAVAAFVEEAKPWLVDRAVDGAPLTFFEVVTGLGIWWFERAGVDVAVLEVGLGGELDATSAVDPIASAVTNVSLEHTNVLGDTVEEIAETKAHVAPEGRPLVTGTEGAALSTVREVADRVGASGVLTVGEDDWRGEGATAEDEHPDVTVAYDGRVTHQQSGVSVAGDGWAVDARLPLLGEHQAMNAGIACILARQAGAELGVDVGRGALERGLAKADWPGRFEVMARSPLTVLDGAHNPEACETVTETLSTFDYDDCHLVVAAMHDKDTAGMAAALPDGATVTTCEPVTDRAEDSEVLARTFETAGYDDVRSTGSVANALSLAREDAADGDAILVTGSLYAVAEARATWTRLQVPKQVDSIDDAETVLRNAQVSEPGIWRMRGKADHRVLHTRVQQRQAEYLKQEMLSLDGECSASALRSGGELHDVVLSGTMAQFKRLAEKLQGQPWGLSELGAEIRRQLGIQHNEPRRDLPWPEDGTAVMGVLNVTPDSFHDGGEYERVEDAVARAEAMVDAGADLIDVGGESTRPGADPVEIQEELDRVLPVVERLADLEVPVSVDTRRPEVARAVVDAGAGVLNDVAGLQDPEMRRVAAETGVPVVLMHSIEAPVDPETEVHYDDVVEETIRELRERLLAAEKAGVDREQVVIDPGIGFGKTARESFELLDRLGEFDALGCPLLFGHSHKSMFELTGEAAGDAPNSTVAASALAAANGADIVRVHDVAENVAAVNVADAADDPEGFEP